jgi:hypothetical protein
VSSYIRHLETEEDRRKKEEEKAERERLKQYSQYVGEVGQRLVFELIYLDTFSFETEWGVMCIHKFKDANNNIIVWKTGNGLGHYNKEGDFISPQQGDTIKLKGRIKEHSEYKDEKQTVLTRCTIL